LDVQDEDGNTPAHLALLSPYKGDDVLAILKKSGANLEIQNKAGQTAASLAK
jgi:ankyrin repeat protein